MPYSFSRHTEPDTIFASHVNDLQIALENMGNAAITVAATDAPADLKARCDYVCDGVADDVQINAAIDAHGGTEGMVFLTPGTFTLAATIDLSDKHDIILAGSGIGTVLDANAGNRSVIDMGDGVSSRAHLGVRDLKIVGGGRANTSAHGIRMRDTNNCNIHNIHFVKCRNAIDVTSDWQSKLSDIRIEGLVDDACQYGMYTHVTALNTALVCSGVSVKDCVADGWRLENVSGMKVVNSEAGACGGYGFYIGDPPSAGYVQFAHFVNVLADTCTLDGWLIKKGTNGTEGRYMQFDNCWSGTVRNGVVIDGMFNVTLSNWQNVFANQHGIQLTNGCARIVITGGFIDAYGVTGTAQYDGINMGNTILSHVTGTHIFSAAAGARDSIREETGADNNTYVGVRTAEGITKVGGGSLFIDSGSGVQSSALWATGGHTIIGGGGDVVPWGILRSISDNAFDFGTAGNRWRRGYFAEYLELDEMTAPAAPGANKVRWFTRDNGSGKTQICAIFPTGAIQVIATEP